MLNTNYRVCLSQSLLCKEIKLYLLLLYSTGLANQPLPKTITQLKEILLLSQCITNFSVFFPICSLNFLSNLRMLFYPKCLWETPTYFASETMAGYNPNSGVLNLYSALLVSLELDFHFIIGLLFFGGLNIPSYLAIFLTFLIPNCSSIYILSLSLIRYF